MSLCIFFPCIIAFYLTYSTDTVGAEVSHMVTELDTRATVWLRAEVSTAPCGPQHTARDCLMCLTLSRPREMRDARLGLRKESTSPILPPFPVALRGILKCSGVAANPYALFWRWSPKRCIALMYEGTGSQVWGVSVQSRRTEICTCFLCNFTSIPHWSLSSYFSGGSSCFYGVCLEKSDSVHCNKQERANDLKLLCNVSLPW